MYKAIPGNKEYKIDLDGNIIDLNNRKVFTKDTKVKIMIKGKEHTFEKKWLALISYYNTNINYLNIEDITFTKVINNPMKTRCRHLMLFKKPQIYFEDYLIIPNYTRYAISTKLNSVLDTHTNTIIPESITPDGYKCVYIFDDDKQISSKCKNKRRNFIFFCKRSF